MERGEYPKYHPLDCCCDTVMTVVIARGERGDMERGEYPEYHPLDYCCDTVMTVVILLPNLVSPQCMHKDV